jgi:hypothetical protein
MYCYCRKCSPPKWLNKRTVKLHLKNDIHHLESGNYSELYIVTIQDGIDNTLKSLGEFDGTWAGLYILLSLTDVLTPMKFQVCLSYRHRAITIRK